MLYIVIAHDGTDAEAPARRQHVRGQHLDAIQEKVTSGALQLGGAILDDDGTMVGSALLVEAEDEAAVRAMLEGDIYHRSGVWQRYEIYPFKRAV